MYVYSGVDAKLVSGTQMFRNEINARLPDGFDLAIKEGRFGLIVSECLVASELASREEAFSPNAVLRQVAYSHLPIIRGLKEESHVRFKTNLRRPWLDEGPSGLTPRERCSLILQNNYEFVTNLLVIFEKIAD